MPAGTIALTNNSTAVTGTGTSFTAELKANDFIVTVVGGVTYTLGVQSVNSATGVTLTTAYNGPTASGVAWTALPNSGLVAITAQVAADVAKAIRGLNLDKANWQQVYSASGNITVTLPDGSQYSGPSWNSVVSSVSGKMDKSQNLNDLTDKATARTNLGLGNSAVFTAQASVTDVTAGRLMRTGAFGMGIPLYTGAISYNAMLALSPGLYQVSGGNFNNASGNYGGMITFGDSTNGAQIFVQNDGAQFGYRGLSNKTVYLVRSTQNTTVDGSGFIKQASPIARLTNDSSMMGDDFCDGFTLSGSAAVNEEAEGVKARRSGLGSYIVTGCLGLAAEGWQIEVPKDINGNRLCFLKSEMTEAGNLSIKVYKPKLDLETGGVIAGDPIDIPEGRWIDLRLSMPDDSTYNTRIQQSEANPAPAE